MKSEQRPIQDNTAIEYYLPTRVILTPTDIYSGLYEARLVTKLKFRREQTASNRVIEEVYDSEVSLKVKTNCNPNLHICPSPTLTLTAFYISKNRPVVSSLKAISNTISYSALVSQFVGSVDSTRPLPDGRFVLDLSVGMKFGAGNTSDTIGEFSNTSADYRIERNVSGGNEKVLVYGTYFYNLADY
jgi:hypothetical protein